MKKEKEIFCAECLKFGRKRKIPCKLHPADSFSCHNFIFSHIETIPLIPTGTIGTMPQERYDVVVCSKCGEVRRYKVISNY